VTPLANGLASLPGQGRPENRFARARLVDTVVGLFSLLGASEVRVVSPTVPRLKAGFVMACRISLDLS